MTRSDTRGGSATWPSQACDTAEPGLRHSRARPMTQLGQACDTAQCARRLGQGCAPYAPNLVLTRDIVLSHCLVHCS